MTSSQLSVSCAAAVDVFVAVVFVVVSTQTTHAVVRDEIISWCKISSISCVLFSLIFNCIDMCTNVYYRDNGADLPAKAVPHQIDTLLIRFFPCHQPAQLVSMMSLVGLQQTSEGQWVCVSERAFSRYANL